MGFLFDFDDILFGKEDVVDVLFSDPEIDGKKAGYEKAAKEYEKVYNELKREHKEIMDQIKGQRMKYDAKNDMLIEQLARLEEKRDNLKERLEYREKRMSEKYGIPINTVHETALSGGFIGESPTIDVIGLLYGYKKKKLMEAEHKGYMEVRELYEEKLRKLKQELREEKKKGYMEVQNLIDLMCDIFEEISQKKMEIAGLEILL